MPSCESSSRCEIRSAPGPLVAHFAADGSEERLCAFRRDLRRRHRLQDACAVQLPARLPRVVIRADGRPARTDRIEDDQLVEGRRRRIQQRKLRVREGRDG